MFPVLMLNNTVSLQVQMGEALWLQGWGQSQNTFEQAPPPGAEWGRANNVVPGQEPAAAAGLLVWHHHPSYIFAHLQIPHSSASSSKAQA